MSLWNWFGFNELQCYAVINCEFLDFSMYGHRGGMIPDIEPPLDEQNHHIRNFVCKEIHLDHLLMAIYKYCQNR